jgi:apolipoprotein N-acyltransferase
MKSLLIIFNLLCAFCALSIDTERSPLWAVAAVVVWLAIAVWLLRYASITEALRALVRVRRVWRSLWRPKFDFEEFNRKFERELKGTQGSEKEKQQIAEAIRKEACVLNSLITDAEKQGLKVSISTNIGAAMIKDPISVNIVEEITY